MTSACAREEAQPDTRKKVPDAQDRPHVTLLDIEVVEHRPDLELPMGLVAKDQSIFQAAVGCGASHVITGDLKHFSPLANRLADTLGIHVQTTADILGSLVG